jgi:hypothetical protein
LKNGRKTKKGKRKKSRMRKKGKNLNKSKEFLIIWKKTEGKRKNRLKSISLEKRWRK